MAPAPSRIVVFAVALIALGAQRGLTADVSISAFFSQRGEVSGAEFGDNTDSDDDVVFRSITDLGLTFSGQSQRSRWSVSPGVRATATTASGDDDPVDLRFRFNGAGAHALSPRHSLSGGLSVTPDFANDTQFDDTGIASNPSVLQITTAANLGLGYTIDQRNALSFGATGRWRTFTEDTESLEETRSVGLSAGWTRSLTPRTSGSLSGSWQLSMTEGDTGSDAQSFSLVAGVSHAVNRRLSLNASLGPSLSYVTQRVAAPGGGTVDDDSVNLSAVGGLGVSYRGPRTSANFSFDQQVDQNSEGDIDNVLSLSAGLSHQIASNLQAGVSARFSFRTPLTGGDTRQTFSISPNISYGLTEDWSLSAGYRFRASNDEDFDGTNRVFLQISRGFDFLP
jgi:opacity protein-like surface antigen